MASFDQSLFYAIHSFAGRSALLDWAIVLVGDYLIYGVVLAVACLAAYAWIKGRRRQSTVYILSLVAGLVARFVVASGIRLIYARARPFDALGVSHILNDSAYSFPSGHTIFMFALATVVYRHNKAFGWCLAAIALFIGLARIAGGVHYPSDIAGGVVLGVLTGLAVSQLTSFVYTTMRWS